MANNRSILSLPAELFEKISGKGDFKARLSLRKTCKQFKDLVDISRCDGHYLAIVVSRDRIRVGFDNDEVEYRDMGTNSCVFHNRVGRSTVLGNSYTSLYDATIEIRNGAEDVGRQLIGLMENFYAAPASFKITKLEVQFQDNTLFLPILSLMSPDNLKSVILRNEGEMQFGQIIDIPQWLNLRKFKQRGIGSVSPDILQRVGHLAKFEVRTPISSQQGYDLIGIWRNTEAFKSCRIEHMDRNFNSREFAEFFGLGDEDHEENWRERFMFNRSTDVWDISASGFVLDFKRVKNNQ